MTGLLNVSVDAVKAMGEAHRDITFVTRNSIQNDQFPANAIRFLLADS